MIRLIWVLAAVLTCLSVNAADKLVFAIRYFQTDRDVAEISNVVVRAAKAGYTGLALVSGRDYTGNWWDADRPDDRTDEFRAAHAALDSWWVMSPDRQRRVREVARICRANGLELVPLLWSVGYNSMRFAEPEVAASIPCEARKVDPAVNPLGLDAAFGGKEESRTLSTTAAVEPYGLYEIEGEVKTEHLQWSEIGGYGCGARCLVSDPEDNGDLIASVSVKGKATRDWTPFALSFASGRHALVKVEVGRWWDSTGSCAFRNLRLRQVPCTDWVMRGGERMTRKWFADRQSSACMSDPRLYAYFKRSAAVVQKEFAPKKWFLSMDEIRVDCDCAACRKTPFAERLGRCLKAQYDAVRAVCPDATVCVWSDMLDPGHNCRSGDPLAALPKDTVIALWDVRRVKDTIDYFTGRGYRVLGAAYYDLQDAKSVRENYATWQKHLNASGMSAGIMYTTWAGWRDCTEGDYRFLEDFGPDLPSVTVGDASLRVESARCSAMPVNIRWPGHQRELDQTEICSFARFGFRCPTEVRVKPNRPFTNAVVRPVSAHVAVKREGDAVLFTVPKVGAYSVEFDGRHENLMLFADPLHEWKLDLTAPSVHYYGPGEHDVGLITLRTGETLFIDEGAVVYGRVFAKDAPNVRICGTGILDSSRVKEVPVPIDPKLAEEQRKKGWAITNVKRFDAIRLMFCDNVRIEGITIRDSQIYAIRPVCCDNLSIDNVKILGSWRYNSDGIDMHNCRKVRIRDSFIRTYDDSICVKGFDYVLPEADMLHDGVMHDLFEDVLVERCTIWNDWGRALEIGAETRAREIRNVTFRNCDVLAVHAIALDVQNCDQAYVHDIVYENIRVEYDPEAPRTVYSASAKDFRPESRCAPAPLAMAVIHYIPEYSKAGAENRGRITDVTFRDIDVFAPTLPLAHLMGFDTNHLVERVSFDRIRLNGQDKTDAFRASIETNAYVHP